MSEVKLEKLNEIIGRITKKQDYYSKKYCVNAPKFVAKNVLNLMLSMQRKMSGFSVISKLYAQEYKYIKSNNSINKLYKRIYNKTKKSVDYLKQNYYYKIVEDYIIFMYRIVDKIGIESYKEDIKKLVKSIELEEFIQNHDEYYMIFEIFEVVNRVNIFTFIENPVEYTIDDYIDVFLKYEELLDKTLSIEDSNLKRAVYYYFELGDFKEVSEIIKNKL